MNIEMKIIIFSDAGEITAGEKGEKFEGVNYPLYGKICETM